MEPKRVSRDWKLVSLIYSLVRDHLPIGVIESEMEDIERCEQRGVVEVKFSNPYLAEYAVDCAERLTSEPPAVNAETDP